MARVGNYTIQKTAQGYTLCTLKGETVKTFSTAREANTEGVRLTAAAFKASRS